MPGKRFLSAILLAAFCGFVLAADGAWADGRGSGQAGSRAGREQTQDAFRPKALGRGLQADGGTAVRKPLWPWLVAGAIVLCGAAYFLAIRPNRADAAGSGRRDFYVQSVPPGAAVFLDGVATGQTTNCILKSVATGTHTVRLEKDGYRDFEAACEVPADLKTPAVLSVQLEKAVLAVSSPAGGDLRETGQTLAIRWTTDFQALQSAAAGTESAGLPNVRIELRKGGQRVAVVAESVPNSGSYDWDVPAGQATGEGQRIRIVCPSDESIYGESGDFTLAARVTLRYEGNTPPSQMYGSTCSFDAPITVPEEGRIAAFRYRMRCYNETGVDITMVAPDGTKLADPSYDYRDFVPTAAFDGHWMRGTWRLEVRDPLVSPYRDDLTFWNGWAIEIDVLRW